MKKKHATQDPPTGSGRPIARASLLSLVATALTLGAGGAAAASPSEAIPAPAPASTEPAMPPAAAPASQQRAEGEKAQEESRPAGGQPGEQKPGEQKPAEEKPAEEKPAEEKPAEEKPAGEKPAAKERKKPLEYPLPEFEPLGTAGRRRMRTLDPRSEEFIPMPDRWSFGYPDFDRYPGRNDRLPWVRSSGPLDPFNQNLFKGDFPIRGNDLFLNLNLQSVTQFNPRRNATAGGPEEQLFLNQNFVAGAEIFRGNTVFEPRRWALRLTSVWNLNYLGRDSFSPGELRSGVDKQSFEEAFYERRLAAFDPSFDFVSVRAGMQNFTSDFRGFLLSDNQLGVRLFGNRRANRDQYNVAWFSMRQRDEVSQLHDGLRDRNQNVYLANYFRNDFIVPGYTALWSLHYNDDHGSPGTEPGHLGVAYLGWHGDGHIGRWNVSHAFYQALGRDSQNRLAGRSVDVNAQMAAVELSRDDDWRRYRFSFLYASGDNDIDDGDGRGFDMIMDNPNFAGGQFMYWDQQRVDLPGVGLLSNKFSLLPNLRNKFTQRSNFVNPGLLLFNAGVDFRVSPKLRAVTNLSYLRFANSRVLRQLSGRDFGNGIGWDLSVGAKYRPFLNENVAIVGGASMLLPEGGVRGALGSSRPLFSVFAAIQLAY